MYLSLSLSLPFSLCTTHFIILHDEPTHHTHHTRQQHSGDSWIECREVASGRTLFYHATTLQIAFDAKPGAGGALTRTR